MVWLRIRLIMGYDIALACAQCSSNARQGVEKKVLSRIHHFLSTNLKLIDSKIAAMVEIRDVMLQLIN